MSSDVWAEAAEGGDEQVKRELMADVDKIERFILQAMNLEDDFAYGTARARGSLISSDYWLLDRLTRELYTLDGKYPFPNWVSNWYQKASAWKAAGFVPPGEE